MARRGRLIAIEGASGSGKTTLVQAAARSLGWRPLAEAFDRLDPAPSLEFGSPRELLWLEAVLLVEEVRRYEEARRATARGETVVADTGFLGPLTYTRGLVDLGRVPPSTSRAVERTVRSLLRNGALGIPDLTVYLTTTVAERRRRARTRGRRHPASLQARHEAVGVIERRFFEEVVATALPDRFRTLRADIRPTELALRLERLVKEARPTPVSRAEALALLVRGRPPAGKRGVRTSAPTVKKPTRPAPHPRDRR